MWLYRTHFNYWLPLATSRDDEHAVWPHKRQVKDYSMKITNHDISCSNDGPKFSHNAIRQAVTMVSGRQFPLHGTSSCFHRSNIQFFINVQQCQHPPTVSTHLPRWVLGGYFNWAPPENDAGWWCWKTGLFVKCVSVKTIIHDLLLHVAMMSVCGDCWFYLGTLISWFLNAQKVQCSLTRSQESNQSDLGHARLLKTAIIHTRSKNSKNK